VNRVGGGVDDDLSGRALILIEHTDFLPSSISSRLCFECGHPGPKRNHNRPRLIVKHRALPTLS
jgi:hypothetical protein